MIHAPTRLLNAAQIVFSLRRSYSQAIYLWWIIIQTTIIYGCIIIGEYKAIALTHTFREGEKYSSFEADY